MEKFRVIGLDLSLTATGIAYADGSTSTVKTRANDGDRRLLRIQDAIRAAIAPGADLIVIEDIPSHGAYMIRTMGIVHGAVRAVLATTNIPHALMSPTSLKAYATGKGAWKRDADGSKNNKAPMANAALEHTGRTFATTDECDAWWLRAAGLDHLGEPEFALPAAQRARLDAVKWPSVRATAAA